MFCISVNKLSELGGCRLALNNKQNAATPRCTRMPPSRNARMSRPPAPPGARCRKALPLKGLSKPRARQCASCQPTAQTSIPSSRSSPSSKTHCAKWLPDDERVPPALPQPRAFGGKLKAAGGRHGEPRDFCYDSAKAAVPQAFLETDEDRRLIARLDIDHAIGHEPGLREGRGEQILPGDTPEHLATRARGNSRREESRGGAVDRAISAAGHLMQRAERQAASREMPVDRLETEGQHQSPAASRALEAPDALAKILDPGTGDGCAHVLGNGLGGWYVPYLFSSCEESQSESDGGRGRLSL